MESTPEDRLIARLLTITDSVWFDPAWDDGVVRQDDGGTWRITSVLSRPIHTQYTVSQGTLAIAPAEAFGPSGKRILSFAGAQYLSGASALAALLQGAAPHSEVSLASRGDGSTRVRWGAARSAAAPDDRIYSGYSGGALRSLRQRVAAGGTTQNTGSIALTSGVVYMWSGTFDGSDYDGWIDGAAETLSGGGANTRAPAVLDEFQWGCQRASGTYASFWIGLQSGLILTPGQVLSATDRQALESDLAEYHGY